MVNSNPLHAKAMEIVLKRLGHSPSEFPREMVSSFMGRRVIDILEEVISYLKLDVNIDALNKERRDIFLKLVQEQLEVMPGLYKSLNFFKKNGYPIALASSGAKQYIGLVLKKFNLENYFNVIISGDDVSKGKPDPEPYLVAAKKLDLDPADCLVLEDATNGIESAKAAGCKCIGVINLNTPLQDRSRADKVINSLEEINLEMINSLA